MKKKTRQGKSGISQISGWDASGYSTQFAGEIKDFDCGEYVSKKNARRMDAVIKYALVAGKKALQAASIDFDKPGPVEGGSGLKLSRCGILVGTAMGGMQTFATAVEDQATKGFRRMNPFCIPFAITNMPGALLAMDLGFMGPNYSISTACATGNYCILQAADHIRRGDADLMLAGGADAAVIPSGIGEFLIFFCVRGGERAGKEREKKREKNLTLPPPPSKQQKRRRKRQQAASRHARPSLRGTTSPSALRGLGTKGGTASSWEVRRELGLSFSYPRRTKKTRRKKKNIFFVPNFLKKKKSKKKKTKIAKKTEGAGVLVLESLEHAQKRGANIICEFAGGALGCDAHHMTEPRPDGSGVAACIQAAVKAGESRPCRFFFIVFEVWVFFARARTCDRERERERLSFFLSAFSRRPFFPPSPSLPLCLKGQELLFLERNSQLPREKTGI